MDNHILDRMRSLMEMPPLEIISNYLSYVKKVLTTKHNYSYLDAEILNKKITNMILGYKVNSNDNLDTVTYLKHNDTFNIENVFELYENFVRFNINKLTGITYTEYKQMTKKEQTILLEYISLKNDTDNIDAELIEKSMDQQENQNKKLYDF